jgi:hypothetical protein
MGSGRAVMLGRRAELLDGTATSFRNDFPELEMF